MAGNLTREELYAKIWQTPVTRLAQEFAISDVALAKRCKREGIPLPPRGYWAKVAAGQAMEKPALPPKPEREKAAPAPRKKAAEPAPEPTPVVRRSAHRWKNRLPKGDRLETF